MDVGCRDGEYTRYLQHEFKHTFCFDAHVSKNFPCNVRLSKVTHFNCALGDTAGIISMYAGNHALMPGKMTDVPCRKLDEFGFTAIDYIKVDVEGFEKKVLLGGQKTIDRCRPLIVIEQGSVEVPFATPYDAKEWLEARAYKHVATCSRGWDHVMVPIEKL